MWDQVCRARRAIGSWASNHKTLLVSTGVVVAVGAGAYYGAQHLMLEAKNMMMDSQRQLVARQRLQIHLTRSKDECKNAFMRFVPSMKTRLYKRLDLEGVVASLKVLDKSDKEMRDTLWEDAKLLAFTRLFASIHSFCLLELLVHCELLILGRKTYERSTAEKSDPESEDMTVQQQFMSSTMEYFFETGLPNLTEELSGRIANHVTLQEWRVSEKGQVSKKELEDLLDNLQKTCLPSTEEDFKKWQSFLIYPDSIPSAKHPEGVLPLLNELWDIFDLPLFQNTLEACINKLFELVSVDILHSLYPHEHGRVTNVEEIKNPPLAKVIPQLKAECARFIMETSKQSTLHKHWEALSALTNLEDLSESIFIQEEAPTLS
ncbi:hypothetical protein THRCLA_11363, partial [Thraustotheca clavata]